MTARGVASFLILAAGVAATSWAADVAPTAKPAADQSMADSTLIARGAELAAIGNCASCHTHPEGKSFAGGRPIKTPFGTLYSTNITPDNETGIGKWSAEDFLRAMHDGVAPGRRNLYPAFPYDHFTRLTDNDVEAIYAFVMTREPVRLTAPPNQLAFPMNLRSALSVWKVLFLERGAYRPDPQQDAEWNRGAYLVEGLGHCGACHTPRNAMGAEEHTRDFDGGQSEGWDAPALNSSSPAPSAWTAEQLYAYLRQGRDENHGTAVGPMKPVVDNLSQVPESDVRAIARYVAWRMNRGQLVRVAATSSDSAQTVIGDGEAIFRGACASCHEAEASGGPIRSGRTVPLSLTTSVNAPDARNAIHIVLEGIWPDAGEKGAFMPPFEGAFTEQQLAALLGYVRSRYARGPAWSDLPKQVRAIMHTGQKQ
ncbi:MAG: c-type cytochrome [Betaproteobacteria bacterium]|nr:MAG: c-type cytochrome [Betaproteobacteria bacterium]